MLSEQEKKKCRICKEKPGEMVLSTNPSNGHKRLCCLACNAKRMKKYRDENKDKIKIISKRYEVANQEKRRAWMKVRYAVVTGKLVKPDACSDCGTEGQLDAHHEDYSKALEVTWVCRKCHKAIHK